MQSYIDSLNSATKKFVEAFSSLTPQELNWKPDAQTWSVGQIIDHVITTNETYFPVFEALAAGTYETSFAAKIPFVPGFIGKMLVNSVRPETLRKMKTVTVFEPTKSEVPADILQRFQEQQQRVIALFRDHPELFSETIIISSPANRNLVYSTQAVADLITNHEHRHFLQAQRVWELQQTAA